MIMKLTILGCYGPYPSPLGGCSGYLMESGDTKLLLDLGSGSLRNYLKYDTLDHLDALILSHLHADHCSDVFVLRYALELNSLVLPLWSPGQPKEEAARLPYKNAFHIHTIHQEYSVRIGAFTVSFLKMKHSVESYAIKLEAEGKTFVYSGDTGMTDYFAEFIRNCDLLLCEAAIADSNEQKKDAHLSAAQVCALSKSAKCKQVVLTHFSPGYTKEQYLSEIRNCTIAAADIILAEENRSIII